jgi:SpoVK/Ycf46/Vps4 family AAA+-type ATPase/HEPN domain-containing protein
MNYDAHEVESLSQQYRTELNRAERAADSGRPQEAAEHYRNAADAKVSIARERGTGIPERVHELRSIADRAEKGDTIRRVDEGAPKHDSRDSTGPRDATGGPANNEDGPSEFREVIESFIVETDTTWDEIGGLEATKTRIKRTLAQGAVGDKPEAVQAAQSCLLFGPPGTGKTMFAKAVATETDATFFNVKLGSLLSQWYGQSSQKIIALFDVARELSPSVVFLDEIDALTTSRAGGSDDTSRRVLNTLLSELSTLRDDDSFAFVLGATNTPWDLDFAIPRRFDHRILVPLPDAPACKEIVRVHTLNGGVEFEGKPSDHLPKTADVKTGQLETPADAVGTACYQRGFTGSDIETLAGQAISNMVHRANPGLAERADGDLTELREESLSTEPIRPDETRAAFDDINPSVSADDITRFHEWNEKFGTG